MHDKPLEIWHAATGPEEAPAILLCPGGPGCCDYLQPVAQFLDDNLRVIRWEPRGCGRSPHAQRYTLAQTLANRADRRPPACREIPPHSRRAPFPLAHS